MAKLPMKPVYFVPAYLSLMVLPYCMPAEEEKYLALAAFAGLWALHLIWIRQVEDSLSETPAFAQNDLARKFYRYQKAVVVITGVLLTGMFFQLTIPSVLEGSLVMQLLNVLVVPWWAFFILMLWAVARSLCFAEGRAKPDAGIILGTGLLFFCIVIGAPFIYARLKRILPAGEAPALPPR